MKIFTYKKILLYLILLSAMVSCNKFGDTNVNPTKSSNLDPAAQLALVQLRFSGDLMINERLGAIMTMPMVQHLGGLNSNGYGQFYIKAPAYMDAYWNETYLHDISNIVDAVERTKDDATKSNLNAMCQIMKVYLFARLTDIYGDIPYSEAGMGYISKNIHPKFDKQEDIYNDFFNELKTAYQQLDVTKDPVSKDLFYAGNITAWKKFANSLRLRLAMRLIKRDPARAEAEALAAYNDGVFTSNADVCKLEHENTTRSYEDIRGNAVSASINSGAGARLPALCNTFLDVLYNMNDPRLSRIARYYLDDEYDAQARVDFTDQAVPVLGYKGIQPTSYVWDDWVTPADYTIPNVGTVTASSYEQKAQLASFLIRNDATFLHLTYAEVEFLLAEAAFRFGGNFGGTPNDHFKKGLEAACGQLSLFPGAPVIPATEVMAFVNGNTLIPGRELEMIGTQLWVNFLLNGPEAYSSWRRTGYPNLVPAFKSGYSTSNTIPRRFEYPLLEKEQNGANVNAAIQAMGGTDTWNGRVWWDKE